MGRAESVVRRLTESRRQLDAAEAELVTVKDRLKLAQADQLHWQNAQKVLQEAAQAVQTQAHRQIAEAVTSCLAAVFDDHYTFHIDFDRKRGKTEARLYFMRHGEEVDPIEASGLGVVDVAALALRIACLRLHSPPVAPVLILDEPMRWVSRANKPKVAALLQKLSDEMGVQIIMTTHDDEFRIGNVMRLD